MRHAGIPTTCLGIVMAFSLFGFFDLPAVRFRSAFAWGALGIGVSACIGVAWWLLSQITSRRVGRGLAVFGYAVTCLLSVLLPALLILLASFFTSDAFHGEDGLFAPAMSYRMFWIAIVAFGLFVPCAIVARRS